MEAEVEAQESIIVDMDEEEAVRFIRDDGGGVGRRFEVDVEVERKAVASSRFMHEGEDDESSELLGVSVLIKGLMG